MSFTENDRIFRSNSGKTFPTGAAADHRPGFTDTIAAALVLEFGDSPAAIKRVAKMLNANERAVRNWFDAKNGPSAEHLVRLMQHSTAVVQTVLVLAGRSELVRANLVADAKDRVRQILRLLDDITDT